MANYLFLLSFLIFCALDMSCRKKLGLDEPQEEETLSESNPEPSSKPTGEMPAEGPEETASEDFSINALSPLAAHKGEIIRVEGSKLTTSARISFGDTPAQNLLYISDKLIDVEVPAMSRLGEKQLNIQQNGKTVAKQFFYAGLNTDFPLFLGTASQICSGDQYYDAQGNLQVGTRTCYTQAVPADCQSDGQVACVATSNYPSVAKTSIDPWNIRIGQTIAGIAGALKTSCRNRVQSSVFNSDTMPPGGSGTTTGTVVQWWDTIDDYANNGAFPSQTVAAWTSDTDCDRNVWKDLTADGACDSSADDCLIQDRITSLTWSESNPVSGNAATTTSKDWSPAVAQCDALVFGSYSDWRLPTQKELQEASIHGIRNVGYSGTGSIRAAGSVNNNDAFIANVDGYYWSSTSVSDSTTSAWYVYLGYGYTYLNFKTNNPYQVLCVRP